jgi:putative protease
LPSPTEGNGSGTLRGPAGGEALELLSPAGNEEKLAYAYRYGADAAYIGLGSFSLRARADNFSFDASPWVDGAGPGAEELATRLRRIKGDRKLYGAFNIFFRNEDLLRLEEDIEAIAQLPIDAFIVSDLGAYTLLRRHLPNARFHLSTQANCINAEAVKAYRDLGFSRIILGREAGIREIDEIRRKVPDVELEAFVHGAMCLAFSGRCYLSAYMTGRSANRGDCTHSCRWHYRLLEEKERPGEYFPVAEEDGYTTILSSKDLNMFDHLGELRDAGVDSIKIEGRMKSLYYTAVVTRAYRRALDALEPEACRAAGRLPPEPSELDTHRSELENVSHREYSTGFYFDNTEADKTTEGSYRRSYEFLGLIAGAVSEPHTEPPGSREERSSAVEATEPCREEGSLRGKGALYALEIRNSIREGERIEYIGPQVISVEDTAFSLFDEEGRHVERADRGPRPFYIRPSVAVEPGYIVRKRRATDLP